MIFPSQMEFNALVYLVDNESPVTGADAEHYLHLPQSRGSQLFRGLRKKGWVEQTKENGKTFYTPTKYGCLLVEHFCLDE